MTQKKTYRIAQVNRLIQEEIASLLLMEMKDPRFHDMTVTEVRTSKDLKHAVVFVATHKERDEQDSLNALQRVAGQIRKTLYGRLRLKHIPELDFKYDESLDRAERIFKKLEEIDLPSQEDGNDDEQNT